MSTVKVRFDGRVFVPEEPVNIPAGSVLELTLPTPDANGQERPLIGLAKLAASFPSDPDWPEDFAAQYEHYIYGQPKQK